jgi:hypothetical protein
MKIKFVLLFLTLVAASLSVIGLLNVAKSLEDHSAGKQYLKARFVEINERSMQASSWMRHNLAFLDYYQQMRSDINADKRMMVEHGCDGVYTAKVEHPKTMFDADPVHSCLELEHFITLFEGQIDRLNRMNDRDVWFKLTGLAM